MKKIAMKKVFCSALMAGALACSAASFAEDIPVNSVILSTSGLANFEHRAKVTGDAQLEFPVRFEQVDDILKSLIVFDKSGRLGGVTLPGKQPLQQVFKDLPFTQEDLSNPVALFNAYQGAQVSLTGASLKATGKLLQAVPEETALEDGKTVTRHRISVMTGEGLRSAILEDMQSVTFEDAKIRGEIARALDAVRENGTQERRVLTVNLLGAGARDVTLSYVVGAPLWKTAYRMVVPEAGETKGLLQGWAVIENMTASDWKDVDLTLVSGNPVTFRQQLYPAYYVSRPEIPVQVFGRVMPRVDAGTTATAQEMEMAEEEGAYEDDMRKDKAPRKRLGMLGRMKGMEAPASAPMAMAESYGGVGGAMMMAMDAAPPPPMEPGMDTLARAASAAASSEATTQVLFRFPGRFDLKSGQSLMLPFLSREVPMERVSLYQPETHPTHPLAAVDIRNDGETGLPPGVLTLYEESALLKGTAFAGDAQLPVMPQGGKRLISYALDSKTTVDRNDKSASTEDKVAIERGVLRIAVRNRAETVYTVKAPPKEARTVIIEHPRMHDYQLVTPDPKEVEVSGDRYRIRVALKAGEKRAVPVALETTVWQAYSLEGMPSDQLRAYATSRGRLDPAARKAFASLAEKRREIDALDQEIYAIDQQRSAIFQDQQRVRENLRSLTARSEVQQKYLDKLNDQEDRIAQLDEDKQKLTGRRLEMQKELSGMIAEIKI